MDINEIVYIYRVVGRIVYLINILYWEIVVEKGNSGGIRWS